ncbi:hypothetical protein OG604_22810 [Streptomyces sp. NBC_01231]|nr:hypothetical protein OG604_22810 [Streptomyces sp. NBC_01231]
MRGLILTGPLGVGKTTAQRILIEQYDFWSPSEATTRKAEERESHLTTHSLDTFTALVKARKLAFPMEFAGNWYAWHSEDLTRMMNEPGKAVVNVRPYTALAMSAILPDMLPVWLWLPDEELMRRRLSRTDQRDRDESMRMRREVRDAEDAGYERMFDRRYQAQPDLIKNLLDLANSE